MVPFSHLCLIQHKTGTGIVTHLLDKNSFQLGRSQEADLPLPLPSVSRLHLRIELEGQDIFLTDLGSANGTFLNGKQVPAQSKILLQAKDWVQLGQSEDTFQFSCFSKPLEFLPLEEQRKSLKMMLSELEKTLEKELQKSLQVEKEKWAQIKLQQETQIKSQAELSLKKAEKEGIETKEQKIREGVLEYQRKMNSMDAEAEKIIQKAELEAQKIRDQAADEASQMKSQARIQSDQAIAEAQDQRKKLMQTATADAAQLKVQAQVEIDRQKQSVMAQQAELGQKMLNFEVEGQALIQKAQIAASELVAQAKQENFLQQEKWQADLQQKIKEAQEESAQILARAQELAQKKVNQAQQDFESEKQKSLLLLHNELENLRADHLKTVERESHDLQRKVIFQYKKEIDQWKDEKEELGQSLNAEKKQLELIIVKKTGLESLEKKLLQSQGELEKSIELLSHDRNKVLALIESKNQVQSNKEKLQEELLTLQKSLDRLNRDIESRKNSADQEILSQKEKSLLEFQNQKKAQIEELAQNRMNALAEIEKLILIEEKKIREVRKNQNLELARGLEIKLIPFLQAQKVTGPEVLSQFKNLVLQATQEILHNSETQIRVQTEHLTSNPEEKQKKRLKNLKWGSALAASFLLVVGLWQKESIQMFFEKAGKNSYAKQIMDDRKKQAVFNPPQDDKYRGNYTDNVIYNRHYLFVKTNQVYTNLWTQKLNDLEFLRSMGLNEESIVSYVAKEANLVIQLGELRKSIDQFYLEQGIKRMRDYEAETVKEITEVLGSAKNWARIQKMEKASLEEFLRKQGSSEVQPAEIPLDPVAEDQKSQ